MNLSRRTLTRGAFGALFVGTGATYLQTYRAHLIANDPEAIEATVVESELLDGEDDPVARATIRVENPTGIAVELTDVIGQIRVGSEPIAGARDIDHRSIESGSAVTVDLEYLALEEFDEHRDAFDAGDVRFGGTVDVRIVHERVRYPIRSGGDGE